MSARRRTPAWVLPLGIALVTFVAFVPALQGEFVAWDDNGNFLTNPEYRGLGWPQLRWMWTTFHFGHYVPLSWMTLGLDYVLWGMNPVGYHVTNVLLHCADTVLVFVVGRRILSMAGAFAGDSSRIVVASAAAALFFGVHPLRVESVAWITERRDMLSLLFYLASLLAYLRSTERGPTWRRSYAAALLLFVAALLSKATAVTLPLLLLVVNVYPLRRRARAGDAPWSAGVRRVGLEVAPFFALSAATGVISLVALPAPAQLGLGDKLAVSAYGLAWYVWKTIVPTGLATLYEMPKVIDALAPRYLAAYAAVAVLFAVPFAVRRRWPVVPAAWVAFFLMILPLLGVVQNGPQIVADRYTYQAAPALALLVGVGFAAVPVALRTLSLWVAGFIGAALVALTWNQSTYWRTSEALWARVLAVGESSVARTALANIYLAEGRLDEAIPHYRRSIELDDRSLEADNNLGIALARQGKFAEAIPHYRRAVEVKPDHYEALNNWGIALAQLDRTDEAIERLSNAIEIRPDFADAHVSWGNALVRAKRPADALTHYEAAARLKPSLVEAHLNWGVALAQLNRFDEAAARWRETLALDAGNAAALEYLSRVDRTDRTRPPRE